MFKFKLSSSDLNQCDYDKKYQVCNFNIFVQLYPIGTRYFFLKNGKFNISKHLLFVKNAFFCNLILITINL